MRLYFGPEELAALRRRAATTHRRYAEALRGWVDQHLDREPLRGLGEAFMRASAEVYFEESFSHVSNVALAYLLTGETRYADAARRWLGALCSYPTTPGNQYAFGPYMAALAHGRDWLADALRPSEQTAIRDHLSALVREAYECSFSADRAWWHGAYLHHDFWIPTAGYGLGALALADEVPEAARWLARAAEEIGHVFDVLGDDGAWLEGAADWVYGLVLVLLFADAHRRSGGESFYERPWLRNTWRYRLYCWLPDDTYVYLNDSFRSGRYNILGSASSHVLRRLAGEYRNGHAQWLAERDEAFDYGSEHPGVYRSPYTWRTNRPYSGALMHCLAWNLLWFDPSVAATPPDELPTAWHFANQGLVIARSGWGPDASVATFACGPIGGHEARRRIAAGERRLVRGATHAHAQATSFTLYAQGRYVVVPPGYGKHASRFQNVVAVDGGQLWDPEHAGELRAVDLADDLDYALGDATGCYPDGLGVRRHMRHFLFLKPDFLVLCDLLETDGRRVGRQYAWQLHTAPDEVAGVPSPAGLTLRALDGAARVEVRLLLPELFGHVSTRIADADGTPLLDEAGVLVTFGLPPDVTFLAVLGLTERALATPVERLAGDGCVGALIGDSSDTRAVLFARSAEAGRLAYDVAPARAGRHVVAGLEPNRGYRVAAGLRPWDRSRAAGALGVAEEEFVNRIAIEPGEETAASGAGLLRFRA